MGTPGLVTGFFITFADEEKRNGRRFQCPGQCSNLADCAKPSLFFIAVVSHLNGISLGIKRRFMHDL